MAAGVIERPQTEPKTVALFLGMFLCAHIIERSTSEETWTITEPGNRSQVKVSWLQKDGIANNQQFRSFYIERDSEENLATMCRYSVANLDIPKSGRATTSHFDRFIHSVDGFVARFVWLRGLNWAVTIAQLVATAVMTTLRAVVRRNLVHKVHPTELDRGYELNWAARHIKKCRNWSVVIWKPDDEAIGYKRLASEVMDARCGLSALSGWECQWQKAVDATAESIETTMNSLCKAPDITITRSLSGAREFEWELLVQIARDCWDDWKVNRSQIEAVLGLWMLHLKIFGKQPLRSVRRVFTKTDGPSERRIYERWIRRQTQAITIDGSEYEKALLLVGKPSVHVSSDDGLGFPAVMSEAPLENICGQIILSAFISTFAKKALEKPFGGQVRARAGLQGVKASFGLRNTILDKLASSVETTGLATIEEAFLSLVPPLEEAKKLPTITDTTAVFSDTAAEIGTLGLDDLKKLNRFFFGFFMLQSPWRLITSPTENGSMPVKYI
ncbi:hypothetical protein FN846DRAFT_998514 [Sphaerosporella brunnea]|uniref:Uncharacterized protein n=1 Tax=Sphaerosporella brunnea TaxID=1250544 RepID=A0A5J5EJQ0_9PEZI|nr:hypothetical protein FN846DRAFT_998514 [Sphaerosporella brunnea]